MITGFVINMFSGVVLGILSLLPRAGSDQDEITSGVEWEAAHGILEPVVQANSWVPIIYMVSMLALMLAVKLLITVYSFAHHLWKMLPFT